MKNDCNNGFNISDLPKSTKNLPENEVPRVRILTLALCFFIFHYKIVSLHPLLKIELHHHSGLDDSKDS